MNRNVHKVLGKTAQLASSNNRGNQTLFSVFAVGIKLSSNNNYSTKKENLINIIPKQLHNNNNKLMNIFIPDFKNYSSSSLNSNNTTQAVNPVEYEGWSKEDVFSLLCTSKENGGAGLSDERVIPLREAGFDGTSLANIINHLQSKDIDYANQKICSNRDYQHISQTTLESVVFWVDNLLKTSLYHLWTVDYLCGQSKDKKLSKELGRLNFNGKKLAEVVRDLETEGIDFATQNLEQQYNSILPIDAKSIILWSVKFSVKGKACKYLETTDFSKSKKETFLKIIDSLKLEYISKDDLKLVAELFTVVAKLEQAFNQYNSNNSKDIFNSFMKPYDLKKEDSLIHLYMSKAEKSASSFLVCCDFAPTFPPNKYKEREQFLSESYQNQHSISTFLEAPGSGKTYFGYHLAKENKYLVIPIDALTCESLVLKLSTLDLTNKDQLDAEVQLFLRFVIGFSSFIYRYGKTNFPNHEHVLNRDVMRFLNNGIKKDISDLYKTLKPVMNRVPRLENVEIVWLLDEAHLLANAVLNIPRTSNNSADGNLLTLLSRQFRSLGPLVLTTTFASSVEGKIEKSITHSSSKIILEKFSYDFTNPLPLLHAKQVVPFLENFISIDKNDEIWKLVSYFVQGPYRRSSFFLQTLLQNCNDNIYTSRNALIYESLVLLFEQSIEEEVKNFQEKFNAHPEYRDMVFNLALFGKYNAKKNFDPKKKFLILSGISFTLDYTADSFKIISPIERIKLMKALQKMYNPQEQDGNDSQKQAGNDWIKKAIATLNVANHVKSHGAEIEITYKVMNNFNSIISKYFRDSDYISKYELNALYIVEDSETSKLAEEKDEKVSTLILNTIRDNMNEMSVENSYPLIDYSCSNYKTENTESNTDIPKYVAEKKETNILPQLLAKPCENAGPDVIGILMLKSEFNHLSYPKCIPLTMAITLMNDLKKCKKNYQTTNIANMYCEHVGSPQQRISTKTNELTERAKIENAIQSITKSGKMLRILVHPHASPTNSIEERKQRISVLSSNNDSVKETPTNNSVILQNDNCVLELYQNDL